MNRLLIIIVILLEFLYSQGWGPEIVAVWRDSAEYRPSMYNVQIAVNGDTLHIVWYGYGVDSAGNFIPDEVFYTRSLDAGFTWEEPRVLSNLDSLDSNMPSICVNGNSVHVAWQEDDAFSFQYRRSIDGGETWGPIITLIPEEESNGGCINNKGDTLVMVALGSSSIYDKFWFRKSLNNGYTWSDPVLVNYWIGGYTRIGVNPPFISIVGQRMDENTQLQEIFYIGSSDLGVTWERETIISEPWNDHSLNPSLYVDNSKIYVIWIDGKYTPYSWTGDIFLRISYDNGFTWKPIRETVSTSHLASPFYGTICEVSNEIHIVWVEEDGFGSELYYRYAIPTGNGYKWSRIDRLTFAQGASTYPSLAYSKGRLHLVWVDTRAEAYGIYYKQKAFINVKEKFKLCFKKENYSKLRNLKIFDITGRRIKNKLREGVFFLKVDDKFQKILKIRG